MLLPDNRGWRWGHAGNASAQLRFDPLLAAVFFEQGRKSEIRAYVYTSGVLQGHRHYTATTDVSDGVIIGATMSERFGQEGPSAWPPDVYDGGMRSSMPRPSTSRPVRPVSMASWGRRRTALNSRMQGRRMPRAVRRRAPFRVSSWMTDTTYRSHGHYARVCTVPPGVICDVERAADVHTG